jgi:hypothetical protein
LAREAGLNIQFDPLLARRLDVEVTVKWTNLTLRRALQTLLDIWDMQLNQIPGNPIFRVVPKDSNEAGPRWTRVNLLENAPTNGEAAATNQVRPEIALNDISLMDAIGQLARQARLNIEYDPALVNRKAADGTLIMSSKVVEKWKNVTARQALQALLDGHGLEITQAPGLPIYRIAAKNP